MGRITPAPAAKASNSVDYDKRHISPSTSGGLSSFHEPPELGTLRRSRKRACRSRQTARLKAARGVEHGFLNRRRRPSQHPLRLLRRDRSTLAKLV